MSKTTNTLTLGNPQPNPYTQFSSHFMEKKTLHHQVAQSLGGSNESSNKIMLPGKLHSDWHRWTGNLTPTDAARFMLLMSIGWQGESPNPELVKWYCKTTLKTTLDELYVRSSLTTATSLEGLVKAHSSIEHRVNHLRVEQILTEKVKLALRKKSVFPSELFPQLPETFLAFFDTEDPQEAILRVFTHVHEGELAWVKPLKAYSRKRIIETLATHTGGTLALEQTRIRLESVLEAHKNNLQRKQAQLSTAYYKTVEEDPATGLPSMLWNLEKALLQDNDQSAA